MDISTKEHWRGLVGAPWRGHSRYENVDADWRASFEDTLFAILAQYPADMQDVTTFIIGSWGMGNAWSLGDIDIVYAPSTRERAIALREQWKAINDADITDFIADASIQSMIRLEVSFGLAPTIGYDVAAHKVIGRPYGVSVAKKYHYDETIMDYVFEDLPLVNKRHGSYLDENDQKHSL